MRNVEFKVLVVPAPMVERLRQIDEYSDADVLWSPRPELVFTAQDEEEIANGQFLVELMGGGVPVVPKQSLDWGRPEEEFIRTLQRLAKRDDVNVVVVVAEDKFGLDVASSLDTKLSKLEFQVSVLVLYGEYVQFITCPEIFDFDDGCSDWVPSDCP